MHKVYLLAAYFMLLYTVLMHGVGKEDSFSSITISVEELFVLDETNINPHIEPVAAPHAPTEIEIQTDECMAAITRADKRIEKLSANPDRYAKLQGRLSRLSGELVAAIVSSDIKHIKIVRSQLEKALCE